MNSQNNHTLPDGWEMKRLGNIAKISSGGTPNREVPKYWNGSIPWITTSLIDLKRIRHAEEFISETGLANSSAKIYPAGTLLMAMYGQGQTRGKVALLEIPATTNQACAAIVANENLVNTDYLFQNLTVRYNEIRNLSNSGKLKRGINKGYSNSPTPPPRTTPDCRRAGHLGPGHRTNH